MASILVTKILTELGILGIRPTRSGANVKKAFTGGKSTATKPGLLAAERDTGGNFATVLDVFKDEAKYIETMNDVEQMAFLNNIMDYKEFGGQSIKSSQGIKGIKALDEIKNSIDELTNKAKSMKDEADINLKSAENDVNSFFETGGDPFKKKNDKFLGGSMSEEGQVRTGIREFLKKEYKNGRINLDKKDIDRVMKYSGLSEDDPILVFKKLYGDEAYKKAGTFPGAFDVGENYNQYEEIFRKNMGTDSLKVKDSKYAGDGKLILTESEEVRTPIKDEDVPFATGGRASFGGGKFVDEIVLMITKKEPIEAMKEVNKIIGKKGKYKNLTQKDIDRIVNQTEDHIFQRDPDNLFVADKKRLLTDDEIRDYEAELGDSETWMMDGTVEEAEKALKNNKDYEAAMKKEYDAASPAERAEVIGSKEPVEDRPMFKKDSSTQVFKDTEGGIKGITMGGDNEFKKAMSEAIQEGMRESENMKRLGLNPSKQSDFFKYEEMKELGQLEKNVTGLSDMSETDTLMQKYPGMDRPLADQIASSSPAMKADMIAMVEQTFKMSEKGMSGDDIIQTFKNTPRTKQALGGRIDYYQGGQAQIEPDLSGIGHGSDALMARNMLIAPGSQATTSTGLNYLLGEDNDTTRVPYNEGLKVEGPDPRILELMLNEKMSYPEALKEFENRMKQQPYIDERFNMGPGPILEAAEGGRIGYKEAGPVVLPKPKPKPNADPLVELQRIYDLYQESMPGVSQETQKYLQQDFIQKLNDAGISQEAFMTYKMQNNFAEGGPARKGFRGGGSDASTTSFSQSFDNQHGTNTAANANTSVDRQQAQGQAQADATNARMANTDLGREQALNNYIAVNYPNQNPNNKTLGQKIGYGLESFFNNPYVRGYATIGTGGFSEKLRQMMMAKKAYDNRDIFQDEIIEDEIRNIPITGGITSNYADGGRIGYAGGKGVDIARRGFLKILGGSVAAVTAFKAGLVKMLGKESGAVSKQAVDQFFASSTSGAPTWFQPLVNKALREGLDITEKAAVKEGQIVRQLDTPNGKVDVTYDTRTGAVDIDYMGGDTAMGEGLQMRYAPGDIIEEGAKKGQKSDDIFEAVESVPELESSTNFSGSRKDLGFAENMSSNVDDLYSNTSELAELGGQKLLIKDISKSIQKKKFLKEMENDPSQFAIDNLPDYDY